MTITTDTRTRVAMARAQLEILYSRADRGIGALHLKDEGVSRFYDVTAPGALDEMAADAVRLSDKTTVYYNVNLIAAKLPPTKRGSVSDVLTVVGFVNDCDIRPGDPTKPQSMGHLEAFATSLPLEPTLLTRSGSGGHVYTLFNEPYIIETEDERDRLRRASKAYGQFVRHKAAEIGWTFDSTPDLARALRLAGTLNRKPIYPKPILVEIVNESGRRYELSDVEDILPESAFDDEPLEAPEEGTTSLTERQIGTIVETVRPAPRDGIRHALSIYLSGWLANKAISEASTVDVVRRVSTTGGDEDVDQKVKNVRDTYASLRAGDRPLGWNGLKQLQADGRLTAAQIETLDKVFRITIRAGGKVYEPRAASMNGNGHGHASGGEPNDEPPATEHPDEPINLSDLGNARRLVRAHGTDLRYCKPFNKWLVWNGRHWCEDDTDAVVRHAKKTVGTIYAEASAAEDDAQRKALAKHALKSEGEARIHAMIGLAQSEPGIPIVPDELDRHPWLLGVENGMIDLRTGTLGPHRRDNLITKCAPVRFDPDAECPTWLGFLERIFAGDDDLIRFVQRGLGSSLSGITRDRVLFILHGSGRNGKSTLLETVKEILGPSYAVKTPADTLLAKRDTGIPNDIAKLRGARFVTAAEADEGRRLAEATIKELTGGDTISARFMRGEFFEFQPAFKMWFATNHRPDIRGTDSAIWDRIRLIPFGVRFVTPDEDPDAPKHLRVDVDLRDKLIAEASGILAWMVQGCLDWQRNGLGYPKAVKDATAGYRTDMDVLGGFIEEQCVVHRNVSVTNGALYDAYTKWAKAAGEEPISQKALTTRLKERGFEPYRDKRGRGWKGLTLRNEDGTYVQGDTFEGGDTW